jgi:hypothetical protein
MVARPAKCKVRHGRLRLEEARYPHLLQAQEGIEDEAKEKVGKACVSS